MDEYLDILTSKGELTNRTALKSKIHSKGYYHNTVHIWFFSRDNKILLQQRAASKLVCPLLWDVSVAGHVDAGESIIEAAIREIKEEIGLTILQGELNKIGVFKCFQTYNNGIQDNEFHHTFIVELKYGLEVLKPEANEVEALKLVSIRKFLELLKDSGKNSHFVPSNKAYYKFVIKCIKEAIKN